MTRAIRRPSALSMRWRIIVVLPLPRKPVMTVAGIFWGIMGLRSGGGMEDRITVCATCREGAGRALADHLASEGIAVRLVECLNACGAPLALAVTGEGKATYLFTGVDPDTQGEEVATFLRLYRDAPGGEVADARSCGQLRFCLLGRIPA